MGKLVDYLGFFYTIREYLRETWAQLGAFEGEKETNFRSRVKERLNRISEKTMERIHEASTQDQDISHLTRSKTRGEMMKISAAVMGEMELGIEFSYAAETAFVSPLLLNLGLPHKRMTLIWCLSPLFGLFITPILGSLSDGCRSRYGRRRPFIFLLSIGIVLGLLLVPNGKLLGVLFGDTPDLSSTNAVFSNAQTEDRNFSLNSTNISGGEMGGIKSQSWGLFFTVLGTVLLDFDADACQSPSRAYMLDVTIPEDHPKGLSTFTIMAGLGGSIGYMFGALDWENTLIGELGQVRAVFTLVLFIFILCVITTLRSFREIPFDQLHNKSNRRMGGEEKEIDSNIKKYGAVDSEQNEIVIMKESNPSFKEYLGSILEMPSSLRWLCGTNFFCWMSLVCYSLYFTDFVGESVFGGDPAAPLGTPLRDKYEAGIRFGCWGMAVYSISCSIYSLSVDHLIQRYGAQKVYIGGQLVYSVGMIFMSLLRSRLGVIFLSVTAGVMYATLFTMPYLLVARYHAAKTFDVEVDDLSEEKTEARGLGTDIAIVSSMVFLAQFTQALTLGNIVNWFGTTTVIIVSASVFAACGALMATKVLYLDL